MEDILAGCRGTNECLCIEKKCCCAANEEQMGIGLIDDPSFILKLGLPCCSCGIKVCAAWPRLTSRSALLTD